MRLIDADFFKEQIAAATLKNNIEPNKGLALMELVDVQPTVIENCLSLEMIKEEYFLKGLEASKTIKWEYESEEIKRVMKEWGIQKGAENERIK